MILLFLGCSIFLQIDESSQVPDHFNKEVPKPDKICELLPQPQKRSGETEDLDFN